MNPDELELEDQAVLEILKLTAEGNLSPKTKPQRRKYRKPPVPERAIRQPKRCKCGTCLRCVEEARWERVFREKFEDPDYYGLKPRSVSSLGWIDNPPLDDRNVNLRSKGDKAA